MCQSKFTTRDWMIFNILMDQKSVEYRGIMYSKSALMDKTEDELLKIQETLYYALEGDSVDNTGNPLEQEDFNI